MHLFTVKSRLQIWDKCLRACVSAHELGKTGRPRRKNTFLAYFSLLYTREVVGKLKNQGFCHIHLSLTHLHGINFSYISAKWDFEVCVTDRIFNFRSRELIAKLNIARLSERIPNLSQQPCMGPRVSWPDGGDGGSISAFN